MRGPHDRPDDGRGLSGPPAVSRPSASVTPGGNADVTLLEQLAEFSRSAGEFGSAMEYYEQILRIAEKARESPELLTEIYFKMAVCRSQTGDYARALEFLDQAAAHGGKMSDMFHCWIQDQRRGPLH